MLHPKMMLASICERFFTTQSNPLRGDAPSGDAGSLVTEARREPDANHKVNFCMERFTYLFNRI